MGRTEDGWRTLWGVASKRRLGRRSVRWYNGWFEAMNRNNILARPKLECEVSGGVGENLKRTGIAGSKGRSSRITANKDMRGCLKRGGNGERRWWRGRDMMLCGRGREEMERGEKSGGKGRGNMKRII